MALRDRPLEELPAPAQWGAAIGNAVASATAGSTSATAGINKRDDSLPPRPLVGSRKAKKKPTLLFASGQRQY